MEKRTQSVEVMFHGIAKGKRKILLHSLSLGELDSPTYELSDDDFVYYGKKAFDLIAEKKFYLSGNTILIATYEQTYDPTTDIIVKRLSPKQQRNIPREKK